METTRPDWCPNDVWNIAKKATNAIAEAMPLGIRRAEIIAKAVILGREITDDRVERAARELSLLDQNQADWSSYLKQARAALEA